MEPNVTPPSSPEAVKAPINWKREIFEWGKAILIAVIVFLLIHHFLFTMVEVKGESMEGTLQSADRLAATILDVKMWGPERGDIIICTYPRGDAPIIKRVIGLPGDTVEVIDGETYVNGEVLDEPYVTQRVTPRHHQYQVAAQLVGEDEYYVMGDNRADSKDSRMPVVGLIQRENIRAKAQLRLYPLNKIGRVK